MRKGSTLRRGVEQVQVRDGEVRRRSRRDVLATEEPFEIRVVPASELADPGPTAEIAHRVSVTMRTPGADFELAAGFLFGEGLIESAQQVAAIRYCVDAKLDGEQQYNIVNVFLTPRTPFDPGALQRNFYVTSSCGVCGKASIDAVRAMSCPPISADVQVNAETLLALPARLRAEQAVFDRTGGLHAAALFSPDGTLLRVREDVGRHNAMDKLIGSALLTNEIPLAEAVLLVSGRLSFELVQKAGRAGVAILAGVSAPSSLAVELAADRGMTLVGFLREERFNVYTGGQRVLCGAPLQTGDMDDPKQ
jgi:FdhD protein